MFFQRGHITGYSKAEWPASLRYSMTQFVVVLVFYISWRHDDMKFIAVFIFLKGFSEEQPKMPKKKEIITACTTH